jgi:hypothetical protein
MPDEQSIAQDARLTQRSEGAPSVSDVELRNVIENPTGSGRLYPVIPDDLPSPQRSISFICVKYSDEFHHNILLSECTQSDLNQFIVVDNSCNINFLTLGQAINAGIERALHDLLVIVHEDVVLLPRWQSMFEHALRKLDQDDPRWLVAGVVGWDEEGRVRGHYSDPHRFKNTFQSGDYAEVSCIDQQVLVLRKSNGLFPDPCLPSIHNIGRDLPNQAKAIGGKTYVLNAPSIHKFLDSSGKRILNATQSIKIRRRNSIAFKSDRHCCDEYFQKKWNIRSDCSPGPVGPSDLDNQNSKTLSSPVIFLGRGGSGTRLLSVMAKDLDLFVGDDLNKMGDSREMANAIYRAVFRKHRCPAGWQQKLIESDLRNCAKEMLRASSWPEMWGFKLPESALVLPDLQAAFPNAKYVMLERDPLSISLQRPNVTAQPDQIIGQVALPLAYSYLGIPHSRILTDPDSVRSAATTEHQISLMLKFRRQIPRTRWLDLNFEQLIRDPLDQLRRLSEYCGRPEMSDLIRQTVDPDRAVVAYATCPLEVLETVRTIVRPSRVALGYERAPFPGLLGTLQNTVSSTLRKLTAPALSKRRDFSAHEVLENTEKIIAVVGCQRSGTTLTAQIVGAPPNALLLDESDGVDEWFRAYCVGDPECDELLRKALTSCQSNYSSALQRIEPQPSGRFLLDSEVRYLVLKVPNLTYEFAAMSKLKHPVAVAYPVRDPRSVVASMMELNNIDFAKNQHEVLTGNEQMAEEFAREAEKIGSFEQREVVRLATIWVIKSGLCDRFTKHGVPAHRFKYEDMVTRPDEICLQLATAIGVRFHENMLAHESVYRGVSPGKSHRKRPIDDASISTWSKTLTSDEEREILSVAGSMMQKLGYT